MASDSTLHWFVRVADGERGPFSAQQLKAFAAGGKIAAATLVRRGDMSGWVRAGSIKGLFPNEPDTAASVTKSDAATPPPRDPGRPDARPPRPQAAAPKTIPSAPGAASLTVLFCSIVCLGLLSAAIVSRFF